jgi:hypothetical protein
MGLLVTLRKGTIRAQIDWDHIASNSLRNVCCRTLGGQSVVFWC